MAINFDEVNGEAKKSDITYFKFEDGENKFRMLGGVLPRYVYWLKSPDGSKNLPVECLSFDREQEKFTNITKDWVNVYFPDIKCSWSYLVQVIDLKDGKLKTLSLKKKLFQQILAISKKHLGDPTDTGTGWDVVVERVKTGPLAYNVEYSLDQMSCKNRALDTDELDLVEELKDIDDLFGRPTPEEQKEFLDRVFFSDNDKDDGNQEEVPNDFDDDIPF